MMDLVLPSPREENGGFLAKRSQRVIMRRTPASQPRPAFALIAFGKKNEIAYFQTFS